MRKGEIDNLGKTTKDKLPVLNLEQRLQNVISLTPVCSSESKSSKITLKSPGGDLLKRSERVSKMQ